MSSARASSKRASESDNLKRKRVVVEDDFDAAISNDIKGIVSALQQIKEKAHKDGQKKNEETISSVSSEINSNLDELKSKLEKERQNFAKALSKSSKECENLLKNETAKFQDIYEKFCKEKATHLQALKVLQCQLQLGIEHITALRTFDYHLACVLTDVVTKHEEEKERLFMRYEQLRKKEKNMLSEHEKESSARIARLDESLKKKKQDDKTFSILRKTLGSFLGNASDEDFPPDD